MILCLLLAVIAGAAMLWIIRPLMGLSGGRLAEDHAARAAGYRAALKALATDRSQALIAAGEAGAERAVLARALIAETVAETVAEPGAATGAAPPVKRWPAYALAGALPLVGLVVYFLTGMDDGRASLMAYTERARTLDLQRQLAQTLKERPKDPTGHRFMAMTEAALGHYAEAAHHYGEALALGERTSELLTLYAEMLALEAGKPVPAALTALDEALSRGPDNLRARIDRAEGRFALADYAGAAEDLKVVLAAVKPDTAWAAALQARIAEAEHAMKGAAPEAGQGGGAPATQAAPAAMIQGMVDRLAARLDADPHDLPGWARLIHSYVVLGDRAKAEAALARARAVFASDAEAKATLDAAERELR
jgi:cytochrome c-type biogenesis protein CcmH